MYYQATASLALHNGYMVEYVGLLDNFEMTGETEDLSRLEHARLHADMLAYILDNETTAEGLLRAFARRILSLAECDQILYKDVGGAHAIINAEGFENVDHAICARCAFFDARNRIYDISEDKVEMDDMSKGAYGTVPPAACPVKSSYVYRVFGNGRLSGHLAVHYIRERHVLTDIERKTFMAIATVLGLALSRLAKRSVGQPRGLLTAVSVTDQTLSMITKQLYGYNLTVNLSEDTFSMIKGSGMDSLVRKLESARTYRAACEIMLDMAKAEYRDRLRQLVSLDYLLNAAQTGAEHEVLEYGFMQGDEERWAEVNVIIAQEGGDRSVVNIIGRDITAARKVQLLHERELKAAVMKDQILSGITQTLYGFNITVNLKDNRYTLIRGTGAENVLGVLEREGCTYSQAIEDLIAYVPEKDKVRCRKFVGRDYLLGLRGRSGFISTDTFEYASSSGRTRWCEVNVFMGVDENGDPVANLLGRDVTEAHEQLDRRERELKAAAAKDQVLSGITQALYGYNLTVNLKTLKYRVITGTGMEAACKVFKQHDDYADALEEKLKFVDARFAPHVASILAPQHLCDLAASGRSGAIGSFEYAATVNGEAQWHETNIFIGTDESGDPVANILGRNITEIHRQTEVQQQLLVAQRSNAAKTSFLFSMSHDIRTPMNAILGFVAMARKLSGGNRPLLECLGKVDLAGNHLLSLINAVLEMGRIESGTIVLKPRACNLVEQAKMMKVVAESNATKRGISLTLTIGEVQHEKVNVDVDRVNQIVQNILGNAIKYTPAGGRVEFELSERPTQRLGHSLYVMKISDTGIGMSPEFLEKIYEPFSREQTSTVSGIEGTGLGMSIVRRLVDMLGGTIDIVSAQNNGTTVTIGIPAKWDAAVEAPETERSVQKDLRLDGMRILLVEDNEMNREIANWMLSEMGAEIVEATNGKEAVEKVASDGAIDLVLMDVQMPVMDGYEATVTIRKTERGRTLPIIALSANAFEEDRRRSREMGMDDHIAKPINTVELVGTLSRHIVTTESGRRFCRSLDVADAAG